VTLTLQQDNTLKPLTDKETAFANYVLEGKGHPEAYRLAYNKPQLEDAKARPQAWRIMQREHIKRYFQQIKDKANTGTVATLHEKRLRLAEIIRDKGASYSDIIKAILADYSISGELHLNQLQAENGQDVSSKERLRKASISDKVAMLRQAREQDKQASQGHFQPNPEPDQPANTDVSTSKDLPLIEAVTWQPDPSQPAP